MSIQPATITPAEARAQLDWLALSNEVGDSERRAELLAVLRAHDEVRETDPVEMIKWAETLERWASDAEAKGQDWRAEENREAAARYRRCAARAQTANDDAMIGEAA